MEIHKEQIDSLNALVRIDIVKDDYQEKVDTILKDYRKSANIPGFRKGQVPLGLIRKQYGKSVTVEEVNKLIQNNLFTFLDKEGIKFLGYPIPRQDNHVNWEEENLSFEFELGLAPDFEVDLNFRKPIVQYQIKLDDKSVDERIENILLQFGEAKEKEEVGESDEIHGVVFAEDVQIEKESSALRMQTLDSKKAIQTLKGAKKEDTVKLKTKGLFKEKYQLASFLGLGPDEVEKLNAEVSFTINEIKERIPAEANQELFDRLFGEGNVKSEEEFREKIRQDIESTYAQQSDQKLLGDITDKLMDSIEFDLPSEFLVKWILNSAKEPMSEEQAREEYQKSEKGIRYDLIESRIVQDHGLEVSPEELENHAMGYLQQQMAQSGYAAMGMNDDFLKNYARQMLENQENAQQFNREILSKKMLELFKEKSNLKKKQVSYDNFIKEVYASKK